MGKTDTEDYSPGRLGPISSADHKFTVEFQQYACCRVTSLHFSDSTANMFCTQECQSKGAGILNDDKTLEEDTPTPPPCSQLEIHP